MVTDQVGGHCNGEGSDGDSGNTISITAPALIVSLLFTGVWGFRFYQRKMRAAAATTNASRRRRVMRAQRAARPSALTPLVSQEAVRLRMERERLAALD